MLPSTFRLWRRACFAVLVASPLALCFACGSDEAIESDGTGQPGGHGFPNLQEEHEPTCAGFQARMKACGLLSDGAYQCYEPVTDADRCEFECVTGSSCPILWDLHCREVPGVLQSCLSLCRTFVCDDGSGLPDSWQCDGELDCFDGSDEVDCPTYQCGSGEVLVERARCNLVEECIDGSDEVGCPGFRCGDGDVIPDFWQCDGEDDCVDASDERGCPLFTCASTGDKLPESRRCDQTHDCLDSSDETGCAEILCR